MTFPLLFRAGFDSLKFNDGWSKFWFGPTANDYKFATFNLIIITFATLLPMIMQLFSLIFGFMRQKQVKLFDNGHKKSPIDKTQAEMDD